MADEAAAPSTGLSPTDDFIDQFLEGESGVKDEPVDTSTDETDSEDVETQEGQLEDSEEGGTEDAEEEGEDEEDSTDEDGNEEDEESEEEEDSEEEDSETDEEDEDDDSSFLSKATLKEHQERINKDPSLRAVHKAMQADYTKKTMEAAKVRDEAQQIVSEYEAFYETLTDVTEGGGREKFLVDAALDNPEAFQRAYDQAVELLENPEDRKKFERERDVEDREAKLKAREKVQAQQAQQARVAQIHQTVEALAGKAGIDGDDEIVMVKELVAKAILENRTKGVHKDVFITDEQIRDTVKAAAARINALRGRAGEDAGRKIRKQRLVDVQKTAKNSKRRVAPKGKRLPTSLPKPPKVANGVDPLDARIDQVLGVQQ